MGEGERVFIPPRYTALTEQKTNTMDQAAPLLGWDLPEAIATLRRLMEANPPGRQSHFSARNQ